LLPNHRSRRIGKSIDVYEYENTNDQQPNLSHDHVQEIPDILVYGPSNFQELCLKLKQRFEGKFEETGELPSSTLIVAKDQTIQPFSIEKTPITSLPSKVLEATHVLSTNLSGFS
jgi:hypothetical protein